MIEFEITLRDTFGEHTRTYQITEEEAARTGDRELLEQISELVLDDIIRNWRSDTPQSADQVSGLKDFL
jgi:hypothetical protein